MEKKEGESDDKKDLKKKKKKKKSEMHWVVICKHCKDVKTERRKEIKNVWFLIEDDREMVGWVMRVINNVGCFLKIIWLNLTSSF